MSDVMMRTESTEAFREDANALLHGQPQVHGDGRRKAILNLVEMLLESDEVATHKKHTPIFEADQDVPSVDEYLQDTGAKAFSNFSMQMGNFEKVLRNFANAARQLGSSIAILSSASRLRERQAQILFLYRQNAVSLFPRRISRDSRDSVFDAQSLNLSMRRSRIWLTRTSSHIMRPIINEALDVEEFPSQMELFAEDVGAFLQCLSEFPEFNDEAVNGSILSFKQDLQYWGHCLSEYKGQFRNPAVQRYLHDLSIDMGEHVECITSALSIFIDVGIPIIQFSQKHGAKNLLNLSTMATLFSAITATTMQYSYELGGNSIADAVNCLWFASLVFSIAAAVNSLLGLSWKQAMYRSPGDRVPWWVLIWIKRSPLAFLVLSVACFSLGLCFFVYASGQAKVTSNITTVLTALTSFGLCAVSAWFATERWIFIRHQGTKWLDDVLTESSESMFENLRVFSHALGKAGSGLAIVGSVVIQLCIVVQRRLLQFFRSCSCVRVKVANDFVLPVSHGSALGNSNQDSNGIPITQQTSDAGPSRSARTAPVSPRGSPSFPPMRPPLLSNPSTASSKQRWRSALRAAIGIPERTIGHDHTTIVVPPTPLESPATPEEQTHTPLKQTLVSRFTGLVPKLKDLEATQELAAHTALVKQLQFSLDGKFLATSSWDQTSLIFRVGETFTLHRILAHPVGLVEKVAWSPDSTHLLTKATRGMKIWTAEDGVCRKTIVRENPVEAVTWCHHGRKFICTEGSKVYLFDTTGKRLDEFDLNSIRIHDLAVTPDDRRFLAVGPLLRSPTGRFPSKCRIEKRLIVYNMELRKIECQVPILEDVHDISLVEPQPNILTALINYEKKMPPQLWKLEIVRDPNSEEESSRLTLRHTYVLKSDVAFTGHSYFGGQENEMVLCAGKSGDICIWDTESGALLHHIRAPPHGGDLTCIAWSHAATNPFMFASGNHDGTVRIWSKPSQSPADKSPTNRNVDDGNRSPRKGQLLQVDVGLLPGPSRASS